MKYNEQEDLALLGLAQPTQQKSGYDEAADLALLGIGGGQTGAFQPSRQRRSEAVPESLGGRVAASAGSFLADLGLGVKQAANDMFARNKKTSLGGDWFYNKIGYDPDKTAADLRAQVAEKRKLDKPLLDSQGGTTGRILGAVGAAIPTMLVPGANTLGGAMLTGSVLGGMEPTAEGESRAANATLGASGGLAGYGLGRLISGGAGAVKNLFTSPQVNPQAAARIADAKSLGIDLTKGQATRNPTQWATERNLRGTPGGIDLMERFTDQNQALINAMNKVGISRGVGTFQTGESAIDALAKTDAAKKLAVDKAYDFARNAADVDTKLNAARLMDNVTRALDDAYLGDKLPAPIRNAINLAGQGGAEITVGKAAQMQRAINGLYGNDPVRNKALAIVRSVIDDEIAQTGTQAGNAFQVAKASAASHFQWQEAVPAAKAVAKGTASPDDFFNKYILGGKVADIRNTMASLPLKQKVAVQNQLLDSIKAKALNGATDETGTFSQAAFNNLLQDLGKEKLTAVLGAQRANELFKIGRVAEAVMRQPANATVNSSNTGAAVANVAGRLAGLPVIGNNIIAPLQLAGRQMQTAQALAPNAGMYMPKPSAFSTRLAYPELFAQYGLLGGALNAP